MATMTATAEKNLKIGIVKDLYTNGFITQRQMEQAIKQIKAGAR